MTLPDDKLESPVLSCIDPDSPSDETPVARVAPPLFITLLPLVTTTSPLSFRVSIPDSSKTLLAPEFLAVCPSDSRLPLE
jgi:hypothetical protein